ncbi:MAG TPA: zinc-binding dehydrogenase [Nocardioidaceae bacterium]|nr:zinc-binding dehydrogenase [Nocardioidaceae bacterium]
MRAVTCTDSKLEVVDLPDPVAAEGQLLLEVTRTGICGSDLHARHHADELADVTAEIGYEGMMRSHQSVVLGHEFSGTVLEHGPRTRTRYRSGTAVVAMPLIRHGDQVHTTGLSAQAPGAYAERVLVQEVLTFPVPNGLSPELAALTEPMAVGLHAVRRGQVGKGRVAVVIGCGPVGLAVIAMLKAQGVRHVIASDFSAGRRALAEAMGADLVVSPDAESPFATAREHGHLTQASQVFDLAVDGMGKLTRLPRWWHAYRAAEKAGLASPKSPVVFECVGVPGMIDRVVSDAPLATRVVVVGVCMGNDTIRPAMAINKEIDLRFVLGYTPLDFRDALHLLAEGKVDAAPLVTGEVGLSGVEAAFAALADPETHAKILIDPRSDAAFPA